MFREQQRRVAAIVLCHALSSHVSCQPGQCAPLRREGPRQLVGVEVPGPTDAEETGGWGVGGSGQQSRHSAHHSHQ